MPLMIEQPVSPSIRDPKGNSDRFEENPRAWMSAWKWRHFSVAAVFCAFFLFNNSMRLFYSDLWGHVAYGNWILDHQALPEEEPFVSLAEGMPVMCSAWLSQVVLALGGRWGGAEGYSALFALSLTLTYLILARVCYLQTRSIGLSVLMAFLAWGVNWGRHAVIRPEMFAGVCFAVLLWLVVRTDSARRRRPGPGDFVELSRQQKITIWLGIPILFALWANLHGSFLVGFAILGGYALGRAWEVFWRERRLKSVLSDVPFRRWVLLTELAVLATLINPYGFDLLLHAALFPSHPNLKDIVEWFSLEMVSIEGVAVGFSWILLLGVFRHSRARIAASDVVLLAVYSLAVCLRVRMVAWYGPVWMLILAPHLKDVCDQCKVSISRRRFPASPTEPGSARAFLFTCLLLWLTFVFSPFSTLVLQGKPRSRDRQYHSQTPLAITDFLREHPPEGLVACPQWWGDWLVWDGPEGLEVMMTTNAVHVVPPKVWRDYMAISAGEAGLEHRLSKYRINTIVVHKAMQSELFRVIRQSLGWKIVYEDDLGLIAVRRHAPKPIGEIADEEQAEVESVPSHLVSFAERD